MSRREWSYWLTRAYESSLGRDPVDAANDADRLAELLAARAADALAGALERSAALDK